LASNYSAENIEGTQQRIGCRGLAFIVRISLASASRSCWLLS
jgi:hypothetical protein